MRCANFLPRTIAMFQTRDVYRDSLGINRSRMLWHDQTWHHTNMKEF